MQRTSVLALVATLLALGAAPATAQPDARVVPDPAAHVDPLIGTGNQGNTFPGAVVPFGMFSFSPEGTRGNTLRAAAPGGYRHDATRLRGFSLTHMSGTGCAGGSGDVPIFPHVGTVTTSPTTDAKDEVYASDFSHADEVARPGRYDVALKSGARAELSATTRTGAARFTFPAERPATVLVHTSKSQVGSSDAHTTVDAATRTVTGSVTSGNFCGYINQEGRRSYYTLHFALEFDQPFTEVGTWRDDVVTPGSTTTSGGTTYGRNGWPVLGKGSGAYLGFAPGSTVNARVGISYVSADNARRNLRAENDGLPIEDVRDNAYRAWQEQLRRIEVGGGSDGDRTKFYTALYHSLLHPNVFSDVNGEYAGTDGRTHRVQRPQRVQYGTFSGWDVYRSQLQLLTLLEPGIGSDIAQSLLNQAEQNGGVWDRWTHANGGTHVMNGDPSPPALAGILAFGGDRFDVRRALASLVRAATRPTPLDLSKDGWAVMSVGQRPSLDKYLRLGYMPSVSNAWGGAAETLEMSGADYAISRLAARVGDRRTQREFAARAQWWQHNYDPVADETGGYVRNRGEDGTWAPDFEPDTGHGFVEGTSAQYTWMVPHNVAGLVAALGGPERANARLDDFFHHEDGGWALARAGGTKSALDNEPSLNAPWLYNYTGQPHKTQQTVREVVNSLWTTGPGGIPGNDDLGAMSSWFVFASIGLYPQVPSRAELVVGSPLFTSVKINRGGGRDITITAPGASPRAMYVRGLEVDGRASTKPWLPESFVERGGRLAFTLAETPDPTWGSAPGDAPPSFREGERPVRHDQPYHLKVEPGDPVVAPGATLAARVVPTKLYEGDPTATYTVTGPPTLSFDPPSGAVPGGFSITAAPGAPQGFHPATVTVAVEGADPVVLPLVVKVAPEGSMLAAVDNTGTSEDETGDGDFDGGGYSYSRQALAAAGLAPGGTGAVDGLSFRWPDSPAGRPDNAVADGQRLDVTGTRLAFVGAATNGARAATAAVTFTDGSTAPVELGFSDWTLGGGGSSPAYGNAVVATTPYRNQSGGGSEEVATHIFATRTFTAPAGKVLRSVTLPVDEDLHVFAIAAEWNI